MADLLKRSFEVWVKKRWLREIDKALKRAHKANNRAMRERYVVEKLIERYNEIYNENLGGGRQ
jgi:hypothetical protein